MKRTDQKSHCAVNFALEAVGDPWSLLIVRDIAFNGKHTFNGFLASEERIAKNILSDRLTRLEQTGIITRRVSADDRRAGFYALTEKGIDLIPVLFVLSSWSVKYDPDTAADKKLGEIYYENPARVIQIAQEAVREGRAVLAGEDNVVKELASSL